MRILVTGGAGFIGSHTTVELLKAGHEVVVVDNFSNSKPEALRRTEELAGKPFVFHQVDLLDRAALDEVFRRHLVDAVIHFAAFKAVGESVSQPLRYYQNNITGTLVLCDDDDQRTASGRWSSARPPPSMATRRRCRCERTFRSAP